MKFKIRLVSKNGFYRVLKNSENNVESTFKHKMNIIHTYYHNFTKFNEYSSFERLGPLV